MRLVSNPDVLLERPCFVAEISGNHNGSLERALKIVKAAHSAGVNAVKLQTYTCDTMTIDSGSDDFLIKDPKSLWHGRQLYELYAEASTPWEWHQPIFNLCRSLGILGFSSPFDISAVEFLEKLNVPMYKIASPENTDLPLIRKVSSTGKPVIVSTGMIERDALDRTVHVARSSGCKDLVLLKCTSAYPAQATEVNLMTIQDMKERYHCPVGFSDHTLGIGVSVAAIALGADMIEKHLTSDRSLGGVDSAFSLEPDEMRSLVEEGGKAYEAIGQVSYGPTQGEELGLRFRRSIYVVRNIQANESITSENIRAIRPGLGLPPSDIDRVMGLKVKRDLKRGMPLKWEYLESS